MKLKNLKYFILSITTCSCFLISLNGYSQKKKTLSFNLALEKTSFYYDSDQKFNFHSSYEFVEAMNSGYRIPFSIELLSQNNQFGISFGHYNSLIENSGTLIDRDYENHGPSGYYASSTTINKLEYVCQISGWFFQINYSRLFNLINHNNFKVNFQPGISLGYEFLPTQVLIGDTVESVYSYSYTNPDTSASVVNPVRIINYNSSYEQIPQRRFIEIKTNITLVFNKIGFGIYGGLRSYKDNYFKLEQLIYKKSTFFFGIKLLYKL